MPLHAINLGSIPGELSIALAGATKQCMKSLITLSALLYMSAIYVYLYVCLFAPITVCRWCSLKEIFVYFCICLIEPMTSHAIG